MQESLEIVFRYPKLVTREVTAAELPGSRKSAPDLPDSATSALSWLVKIRPAQSRHVASWRVGHDPRYVAPRVTTLGGEQVVGVVGTPWRYSNIFGSCGRAGEASVS